DLLQTAQGQRRSQLLDGGGARREDGAMGVRLGCTARRGGAIEQRADATRNGSAGVDPAERPRRGRGKLGREQREMGAGEDYGVDAFGAGLVEQASEGALDRRPSDE